jgi:hypothetical protein
MRWHYRDPALLWLFVPAYAAHLLEEYFAAFRRWVALVAGGELPLSVFVAINAVGMTFLLLAIRAAVKRERAGWAAVAVATIAGVNGLAHAGGTIATGVYAPGLVTGIVFYVPLALLTLTRAVHQAEPGQVARGVAIGVVVHVLVAVAAFGFT